MRPAALDNHLRNPEPPCHQLAGMTDSRRYGPSRDIRVGRLLAVFESVRKPTETASKNDADAHINIPAIQADMKLAIVPAATAFIPSRARSDFRDGASAPMPPTWIATELRLAKPHN